MFWNVMHLNANHTNVPIFTKTYLEINWDYQRIPVLAKVGYLGPV